MEFKRDLHREHLYKYSKYKIEPQVYVNYEMNPDGTFKIITFKYKYKDREWTLIEFYKDNTNTTDYCTLTGVDKKFKHFVDAETELMELMKNG